MSEFIGSYYSEGTTFKSISSLSDKVFDSGTCFYEVLRVLNKNCLFLTDHLQRLQNSVTLAGLDYTFNFQDVSAIIRELIRVNTLESGNIRLVLQVREELPLLLYTYCVPSSYPSPRLYEKGVPTAVYAVTRTNPNIKQHYPFYQQQMRDFIRRMNIYEALLCDKLNCITEGSKSNVFFIRQDCVLTAPGETVLKGITREKVLLLCKQLNYSVLENTISIDSLSSMEAVFLTGTSPKILPVHCIDRLSYAVDHIMMRTLMAAYDRLIIEDINRWQAACQ